MYAVWNPHLNFVFEKIDKAQRRATRCMPVFRDLSYENKIYKLYLTTLKSRKSYDIIILYKCVEVKINHRNEYMILRKSSSSRSTKNI